MQIKAGIEAALWQASIHPICKLEVTPAAKETT
jgi:hypothetical protein